jgi:hypothetical protein
MPPPVPPITGRTAVRRPARAGLKEFALPPRRGDGAAVPAAEGPADDRDNRSGTFCRSPASSSLLAPSCSQAPGAYWGHAPDHRDNPRRDPRCIACRHGCGQDRRNAQDVSHHRADRGGRHHHRVARGPASSPRLARRSRCGHPMPSTARAASGVLSSSAEGPDDRKGELARSATLPGSPGPASDQGEPFGEPTWTGFRRQSATPGHCSGWSSAQRALPGDVRRRPGRDWGSRGRRFKSGRPDWSEG